MEGGGVCSLKREERGNRVLLYCVAQLAKHGTCNARVVGSIPMGEQYKNVCIHNCNLHWIRALAK